MALGAPKTLMTEVWVAGADGDGQRRLGAFPGEPGGVHFLPDGEGVVYLERGLSYAAFGSHLCGGHDLFLVQDRAWVLHTEGVPEQVAVRAEMGEAARLEAGDGRTTMSPATVKAPVDGRAAALGPRALADTEAALALLAGGLDLVLKGYHAAHREDCRAARDAYKAAVREFEAIRDRHPASGLSQEVVNGYVQALRSRAEMEEADCELVVSLEHMLVLGDLMDRYVEAHGQALPRHLDALRNWVSHWIEAGTSDAAICERDLAALSQIFRCPADPDTERPVSYVYRPDGTVEMPVLTSFWHPGKVLNLYGKPGAWRVATLDFRQDEIDSLSAAATHHLEAGEPDRAIALLEVVAHQRPEDPFARIQLGHACLEAGDDARAEGAVGEAVSMGKGQALARAYYGMGLVYARRPKELYRAIGYFRDALRRDRDYVDARYQIARARCLLWEYDARADIEKVLEKDPDYADAYMLMGDWYANLKEDFEEAIPWYTRYMSMRPRDPEGRERLSRVYLKVKDYDRVMETLLGFVKEHPEAVELMPIVAQACVKQDKLDMGLGFYRAYISRLDEEERARYEDIGLIALKEELAAYSQTSGAERERFLRRFWYERDPDLSTPVNERLLEHYRRVWFARQVFADAQQPWDRRGEVYIRFGEPDHRTSSLMMNAQQDLAVQRVKERMAYDIYGAGAVGETYIGPVFPVRSMVMAGRRFDDEGLDAGELQEVSVEDVGLEQSLEDPGTLQGARDAIEESGSTSEGASGMESGFAGDLRPSASAFESVPTGEYGSVTGSGMDVSRVSWESWVYTRIGGGIELTFTDETHRGTYDYAPVPMATEFSTGQIARFARYAPRTLAERAIAVSPDLYVPEYGASFDFYFDTASFRGRNGSSALEVYYGVPNAAGRYVGEEDVTRMVVDRQIALIPATFDTVYRAGGDLVYEAPGRQDANGGFVPDVVRLEAPPGRYKLEVRARNRFNGRLGIYRKDVKPEAYGPDRLRLSDLELAWRISQGRPGGRFTRGDVQVIPIPTRLFRKGQSVFVYYELYNLTRDDFGQTKYQVAYTIAPREGGIVSRLVRTLGGQRGKTSVGYEQLGFGESESAYVELDLAACRPGRHYVKVAVTDLVSGQKAEKEAFFRVAE